MLEWEMLSLRRRNEDEEEFVRFSMVFRCFRWDGILFILLIWKLFVSRIFVSSISFSFLKNMLNFVEMSPRIRNDGKTTINLFLMLWKNSTNFSARFGTAPRAEQTEKLVDNFKNSKRGESNESYIKRDVVTYASSRGGVWRWTWNTCSFHLLILPRKQVNCLTIFYSHSKRAAVVYLFSVLWTSTSRTNFNNFTKHYERRHNIDKPNAIFKNVGRQ